MKLLLRLVLHAALFMGVSHLVPGFHVDSWQAAALAAICFGVVNAVIRPILSLVSLPITILSLGLFQLVINAVMVALTAYLVPGFQLDGFLPALLGWMALSVGGMIIHAVVK